MPSITRGRALRQAFRENPTRRDRALHCDLYKEADWWTLNDLRILIGKLVGIDIDDPEGRALGSILFNLRHANLEALEWTSRCLAAILQSQREQQTK